jgi:hypothetical protein
MANLHNPQRMEGESFSDYAKRRAASNRAVRESRRNPNHGLVGARQKYRDSMRENGAMGKRTRASDALMAAWASKRVIKTVLRDEVGAYTLTGRNLPVYGMNAWDRDRIVGWTPGRRVWDGK